MDIDRYITRNWRNKNCWHLVREAWLDLTGVDVGDRTPERMSKSALMGRFETDVPEFTKLPGPIDPSIVLMRSHGRVPHVGVYLRGRVLQLTESRCTFLTHALATSGWAEVDYYR